MGLVGSAAVPAGRLGWGQWAFSGPMHAHGFIAFAQPVFPSACPSAQESLCKRQRPSVLPQHHITPKRKTSLWSWKQEREKEEVFKKIKINVTSIGFPLFSPYWNKEKLMTEKLWQEAKWWCCLYRWWHNRTPYSGTSPALKQMPQCLRWTIWKSLQENDSVILGDNSYLTVQLRNL